MFTQLHKRPFERPVDQERVVLKLVLKTSFFEIHKSVFTPHSDDDFNSSSRIRGACGSVWAFPSSLREVRQSISGTVLAEGPRIIYVETRLLAIR